MRLELQMLAGDQTKRFLSDLTKIIDRFEKSVSKAEKLTKGKGSDDTTEVEGDSGDGSDESSFDSAPRSRHTKRNSGKSKTAQRASSFEDEESEEETSFDSDELAETASDDPADFDDEDKEFGREDESSFDEEEAEEEKPAQKTKGKKGSKKEAVLEHPTLDDVNDACVERATRSNRAEVVSLLKKHFKTRTVSDLDESDYVRCIAIMKKK